MMNKPLLKKVYTQADIENWENSEAYQDIIGFLTAMNDSVRGQKNSCEYIESETIGNLRKMLETISKWIDEIPPTDQPQRFGNKAFQIFFNKLQDNSHSLLGDFLLPNFEEYIPQLATYLTESFGNSTRIDYGTGHELAFIMFLCCLHKVEILHKDDSVATVLLIFKEYLNLARKLQMTYKMEPAGSQGVWSLDDFQFVPFIWGSSQLIMNPKITPDMFTQKSVVDTFAEEYLFIGCVQYITSVKTGPFAEHSNQLWNISGVKSWTKINQGLFKMYKAEILNKYPVIQHVLFGSILSFERAKKIQFTTSSDMGALKSSIGIMAGASNRRMAPMNIENSVLTSKMRPPGGSVPSLNRAIPRDSMKLYNHPKMPSSEESNSFKSDMSGVK